jgi:hypothetical protein
VEQRTVDGASRRATAKASRRIDTHRIHPGCEQGFATAGRCRLAANSRADATGGVLVPSEHYIGLFYEWVTQQLDTYVGHA